MSHSGIGHPGPRADHGRSFTEVSELFNTTLENDLQQKSLGNSVIILDGFSFLDSAIANPQANGFAVSNTGVACDLPAQTAKATELKLNDPSLFGISLFCSPATYVTPDADQTFMFADALHPTTHLYELFAQSVEHQIERSWLDE